MGELEIWRFGLAIHQKDGEVSVGFSPCRNFEAWGKEGSSTRLAPARLGRLAVWRRSKHLVFCPSLKLSIKLMLHLSTSDISKGLFRGMWKY